MSDALTDALARCDREIAAAEAEPHATIYVLMQWADWHAEKTLILQQIAASSTPGDYSPAALAATSGA